MQRSNIFSWMILLGLKDIGQIQGFILAYYTAVVWLVGFIHIFFE